MNRDLTALAGRAWDVAVVGGGIYGICAVREAARRGLTACLIDRGDFVGTASCDCGKDAAAIDASSAAGRPRR